MRYKYLLLLLILFSNILNAQSLVVQSEGSEGPIFPAPGWRAENGANATNISFSRIAAAGTNNPNASALSGGGSSMLMLNSFVANAGESTFLISKPYDFSNNGGVDPTFSFWMYRDNTNASNNDKIEVFWNNTPTTTSMVAINHSAGVNYINRPVSSFPVVPTVGWYQYTFTLPAASYNGKKNYFIIRLN